jgi:CDP-diacylglycerol--glycerol-3-phosphate 3-phosphatidyltransferase
LCDVVDGDLARRRGRASRFGAFLDSTLDRVAEFALFGGFLYYMMHRPGGVDDFVFVVTIAALTGSVMTSYARARAEGLGYGCTVGIMERPERIAALTLGLLLGYRVLTVILTLLAVATLYTFIQRIVHVYRVASADERPLDAAGPEAAGEPAGEPAREPDTADTPSE